MTLDIPSDLFHFEPFPYECAPENFVVVTDDTNAAVDALTRAGERMICVDEAGVEHPDYDTANAGGKYAPPSYVANPRGDTGRGARLRGLRWRHVSEQAATFRTILRPELEDAGVNGTVRTFWYDETGRAQIDR